MLTARCGLSDPAGSNIPRWQCYAKDYSFVAGPWIDHERKSPARIHRQRSAPRAADHAAPRHREQHIATSDPLAATSCQAHYQPGRHWIQEVMNDFLLTFRVGSCRER